MERIKNHHRRTESELLQTWEPGKVEGEPRSRLNTGNYVTDEISTTSLTWFPECPQPAAQRGGGWMSSSEGAVP